MRNHVGELFHEVADLSVDARARYFAERDIGPATQEELKELVAFDSHTSMSLAWNIGQVAEGALARIEPSGKECGPYQLRDLLGRGGMGAVYLAERIDGEVAQRVAVKLLRPGADDPALRQRFLAERQILANLSHPNIARLLDAGHSQDGQPYLVMEYVEGKAIDVYATGLGVRQVITMFLKVCASVSYLHRNLVVHRDLKPSNILVTDESEPKLLDFGIAKMLDLTADSVTGGCMLTPDYASPEQVVGSAATTATDIYSLGAVLYKLLTGASPHRFEGDSVAAIVMAISAGRITPPSGLAPGLKGDLETILMKALRKDPEERYATIEQFSEDLECYLESRPIRARKNDARYRTWKFLRRYWLPVVAATLALAGLSGGVLVANRQRAIAERRFVQVRQLANKLFDIDAEVRRTPGSTKVRETISSTATLYLQRLARDAGGDPDLALEVGSAYLRLARLQGGPVAPNLGHVEQAERSLRMAEALLRSVLSARPADRTAMLRSAQVAHDRMILAGNRGATDEAFGYARKSAGWLQKYEGSGKADPSETDALAMTYTDVAARYVTAGQYEEAIRLGGRAFDIARSAGVEERAGVALITAAEAFRQQGELDEALRTIRESARILTPPAGITDHSRTSAFLTACMREGQILGEDEAISLGRFEEALVTLERSFTMAENIAHEDADDADSRSRVATAGLLLGGILRHLNSRRAVAVYDHTLSRLAEVRDDPRSRRQEVRALAGSSYPLRRLGRNAEARQRLDTAFTRLSELKLYPAEYIRPGSEADETLRALADYEAARGQVPRAIEIYEELLRKALASKQQQDASLPDAVDMSRLYSALALLHRRARRTGMAAAVEGQRLELWRHWSARLPHNSFVLRQLNATGGRAQRY